MKRKLISLILIFVLCLSLATGAAAADTDFVQDSLGVLSDDALVDLNEMAAEIDEGMGVGIYYVYTLMPSMADYDIAALVGDRTDYYVMMENEDSWNYFAGGKGAQLDTDVLRAVYDDTETYAEGVEAYLLEASIQLIDFQDAPVEEDLLVWDGAALLSQSEVAALNSKLLTTSQAYNAELRVVTLPSLDGEDIDVFLNALYDDSGFGYGENHDGVLLLVCMSPRQYRILSNGFAGEAITSGDIEDMGEAFVSDLSEGNYADAFDIFAEQCENYLESYGTFNVGMNLLIAVVVGLVVALIVTGVWKGQLKSVRRKNEANAYVKAGTMQITQSGDFFMYRNVTKTQKQSSSSSGSSGSSRSTGGGSF